MQLDDKHHAGMAYNWACAPVSCYWCITTIFSGGQIPQAQPSVLYILQTLILVVSETQWLDSQILLTGEMGLEPRCFSYLRGWTSYRKCILYPNYGDTWNTMTNRQSPSEYMQIQCNSLSDNQSQPSWGAKNYPRKKKMLCYQW